MKAIVLGAGASYGASHYSDVRSPMVNGILSTASLLGLVDPEYAKDHNALLRAEFCAQGANMDIFDSLLSAPDDGSHLIVLREFVKEQFGVNPEQYETHPIDFERLFALVEAELLGYHGVLKLTAQSLRGPSPADVLEMQTMFVLCGSILGSTRDLTCEYHDKLARWLTDGDLVLSFNYDLLIDRSLKKRGDWFLDDGYGLEFARIGHREDQNILWRKINKTQSSIRLHKPHGSLNWLYPRDSRVTVLHADLRGLPSRTPPKKLYCLDDMHPRFEEDHPVYEWWEKYDMQYRGYMFDLHSVIVPPSISKPYRSFEPLVGSLWASTLWHLLNKATEIYFIGYSLRPDDARSWWLFRKVVSESRTLKRAVVIDPSDDVFDRIQRALTPLPVDRGSRTIGEFANEELRGI